MNKLQQAYLNGFCKVAESYGVDPVQLAKIAQEKKEKSHAKANMISEVAGNVTAPLLIGLLTKNPELARSVAALGHNAGGLTALLTRHRSREDQAAEDKDSHVLRNLLVPGFGAHGMYKRLGSTVN